MIQEIQKEIKSISSVEDFKKIQPYGRYVLLNDIDLTDAGTTRMNLHLEILIFLFMEI